MSRSDETLDIGGRSPGNFVDDYVHRDRNPLDIVLEVNRGLPEPHCRRLAYYAIQEGIRDEILSIANPRVVRRMQIRRGYKRGAPRQ